MDKFKLLAIRPLKGCNPKYLKKLEENRLFKFSSGFEIPVFPDDPLERSLKFSSNLPENLYSIKKSEFINQPPMKLSVQVSAIVGKNGSGKSTLIELLFLCIYNFSVEKGILKSKEEREGKKDPKPLYYEENVKVELFYQQGEHIYCLLINSSENTDMSTNVSTLYEYVRKPGRKNWSYHRIIKTPERHLFDHFFYTIAINYSIYSLNSDHIGDWIEPLFHKNDSYQTPIVINPMRDLGMIDINVENDLVEQRLLCNILQPIQDIKLIEHTLRNLAPGKNVHFLKLELPKEKIDDYAAIATNEEEKNKSLFEEFYFRYTGEQVLTWALGTEASNMRNYVIAKFKKICKKYPSYRQFLEYEKIIEIKNFISMLIADGSHITFKLKQATNLIRYYERIQETKNPKGWIDIQKYSLFAKKAMNEAEQRGTHLSMIELIPPAVYEITILFDENEHSLEDFSSGEKQRVHSINSILYHIINLNSVFYNLADLGKAKKLNSYPYINIVFDEIELYFHPDLQRLFVHDLLESIKKMNRGHYIRIRGIQLMFITHSPFILSDIHSENILYLAADKHTGMIRPAISKGETFGANIHDLLAHDFFMENGFMGEFAKKEIQSVIQYLDEKIADSTIENYKWNETTVKQMIDMIGEPMIRKSLLDLYFKAFGQHAIKKEIARLKAMSDRMERRNKS